MCSITKAHGKKKVGKTEKIPKFGQDGQRWKGERRVQGKG